MVSKLARVVRKHCSGIVAVLFVVRVLATILHTTGTSGRLSSATASRGSWLSSWTPTRRSGLRGRPSKSEGLTSPRTTRGDRWDRSQDANRDVDVEHMDPIQV